MESGNCGKREVGPGNQALGSDLQNLLNFFVITEANNVLLFFLILDMRKILDTEKSALKPLYIPVLAGTVLSLV